MGGKFTDRYRRRSLLATLLLLFKGRAKYVTISVLMAVASLPFVVSTETIGRMLELSPVASFLKSVGLGGVISAINPVYSNADLKEALDRVAAKSSRDSYWSKFFSGMAAGAPSADSPSSILLVRLAGDTFGDPTVKVSKPAGPVKEVITKEEKARGEGVGAVDLEGLKGELMRQQLAEAYGSGPYLGGTPALGGGVVSKEEGIYNYAMDKAGNRIPVPGGPKQLKFNRMGKVSAFSWKNVGAKRNKSPNANKGNKKFTPLFQLTETYATVGAANRFGDSSPEYQAAYEGATYDGNELNLEVLENDMAIPDTGIVDSLMNAAGGQLKVAKECTDAMAAEGAMMSEKSAEMDSITSGMGEAPKCYDKGAVSEWNGKVERMNGLCIEFNAADDRLSAKCQTSNSDRMDCSTYTKDTENGGMRIKPCKKPKPPTGSGWMFLLLLFLFILAILIVVAVIAAIAGMLGLFILAMAAFTAMLAGGAMAAGMIKAKIMAAMAGFQAGAGGGTGGAGGG